MSPKLKSIIRPVYRTAIDVLPAHWHVMLDFFRFHRRFPDLKNPKTFNEKIAWRKLYERNPLMPVLVDKIKAKEYVAQKFGAECIIPTIAVYDSVDQLDFSKPPLSQPPYVLKTNHGSGFNIFVKEPVKNPDDIRARLAKMMKVDYAGLMEEWAYSLVSRKILVEPYIDTPQDYIPDYKFHVFGGKVFAIEMIIDRFNSYRINFYDRNWEQLDIRRYAKRPRYDGRVQKPASLPRMIEIAEALASDFPYARMDLYEIDGVVKFGEFTFYPGGGFDKFEPADWDEKFGRQWRQDWSRRGAA